MVTEVKIDWNVFGYKYSGNPQKAFEDLTYCLFCHEFRRPFGIFRYFNQPHIETEPIEEGDKKIGFQAKFYSDGVSMSSKEGELISAVKGAAASYPGINTLYFYISKEFSPSSRRDAVKPEYLTRIENAGTESGIRIVWKVRSSIEAQLMQHKELKWCKNIFFKTESETEKTLNKLKVHKDEIFHPIRTSMSCQGQELIFDFNKPDFTGFYKSDDQIMLIDGVAGSGKSAIVKRYLYEGQGKYDALFAFKCTDFDKESETEFSALFGELTWEEILDVYQEAENKVFYVDAAEKYYILENQELLEILIEKCAARGWKIVLSLRTAYKEAMRADFLGKYATRSFTARTLTELDLRQLSEKYGFQLSNDPKLLDLLTVPFFLRLYFSLEDIDGSEMTELTKSVFLRKVWNEVIRKNKNRKDNMPTRREQALWNMTVKMLQEDVYLYKSEAQDDYQAFSELEQSGVIEQTEDTRYYVHGHDVFEEMAAEHIFTESYQEKESLKEIFALIRPTLRARKLFRNWMVNYSDTQGFHLRILETLSASEVNTVWRDEVLLAVLSTEEMQDIFIKLSQKMEKDHYEMLKKMARMVNTCCRTVFPSQIPKKMGRLMPYRMAKPAGYVWKALLEYLERNKEEICWDKELASIVIEVLASWTEQESNKQSENTVLAGRLGLYLWEKMQEATEFKYALRDEQRRKLKSIILNSAFMIKPELSDIFQIVIDNMKPSESPAGFIYEPKRMQSLAPSEYTELAEMAVGSIEKCGRAPQALPEMVFRLMDKLWIRPFDYSWYEGHEMDDYFGLNSYVSSGCHPHSAYQTPIIAMFREKQMPATDFLIDICNKTGKAYQKSRLNRDSRECSTIMIHIDGRDVEQTASDRLWKMYRGTHVGPDLLISLLMGYEAWLLEVVGNSDEKVLTDYFRYVLGSSANVMLTAVVVSICECFPEKMIDIICDLIRTKEIFRMDVSRLCVEKQASFLLFGNSLYERERIASNKLPHRSKDLVNIILELQKSPGEKREKIWGAIDAATAEIDSWEIAEKFAYYKMDVRRFTKKVTVREESGEEVSGLAPEFTAEMVQESRKTQRVNEEYYKFLDLQLWSDYKFHNNMEYKKYAKYEDVETAVKELREVTKLLKKKEIMQSFRYRACVSFGCTVLLRDHKDSLNSKSLAFCREQIMQQGIYFIGSSDMEIVQAGNGVEAVVAGLCRMLEESGVSEKAEIRMLLLLFLLRDLSYDSKPAEQIAKGIWNGNSKEGWRFLRAVSFAEEKYEQERAKNYKLHVLQFVKENEEKIYRLLDGSGEEFNIAGLELHTQLLLTTLTAPSAQVAVTLADQTKNTLMELAFGKKDRKNHRDLIGYTLQYIQWLSNVLLLCNASDRKKLVEAYLDAANWEANDNNEYFVTVLIMNQETLDRSAAFWEIWDLLKDTMLSIGGNKTEYYLHNEYPCGTDKLLISYLFGNACWVKGIRSCKFLTREREGFFGDFAENSKSVKALMYAIGRLLNTAGSETYEECGIYWLFCLVRRDPECKLTLYNYTMYYLEEYVGLFAEKHRAEFRSNAQLFHMLQTVLEYLVNQGSVIAFFIREQM